SFAHRHDVCIMAHMFVSTRTTSHGAAQAAPASITGGALVNAAAIVIALALTTATLSAQTSPNRQPDAAQDDPLRFEMPTVTVTAQKTEEDKQKIPVSVTAVPKDTIEGAGVHIVSDAAIFAPNTYFTEWSARKLSNARFRGIGSSPNNPGITTYIDGVPQLNTNSSNIEFLDIEQVEFVRGPQSALFGRNTLGGLINISTERPSLTVWKGGVTAFLANRSEWDGRASVSGPISDKIGVRMTAGHEARDGFTVNDVTGHDLDYRRTSFGKAQLWWTPTSKWEMRLIVTGQRDQDGDYALNDLAALRQNPFHSSRDFEGIVQRDVLSSTAQIRWEGSRYTFGSTTGVVNWKTRDVTDLDYTARPLITRDNKERDVQFTQEARFASAPGAPARLGEGVRL